MNVSLTRHQLLDALSWAVRFVPARPVTPLMACLRLSTCSSGLSVSAFDHEVSAETSVPAEVPEAGVAFVNGRLLTGIVRSLPAGPVQLAAGDTRLTVRCGASVFTLLLVPGEAYPATPRMPPAAGTVGSAAWADAVSQVAMAASAGDTPPVLAGVRIELAGETLTLAGTDKYRLAVRDLRWNPAQPQSPDAAILVPARTLNAAAQSMTSSAETCIHLTCTDVPQWAGIAGFSSGRQQITLRLIPGDYPAWRERFPAEFCTQAEVPAAALSDAITRVSLVAGRNDPVRLAVRKDYVTVAAGYDEQDKAAEEVDVTWIGGDPEFDIAFSAPYLLAGITALDADTARLAFTSPSGPAVLTGKTRGSSRSPGLKAGFSYVLMPVRPAVNVQETR